MACTDKPMPLPLPSPLSDPEPGALFAAFVEPHYDVLYRTAYRFTRSVHDAQDLVQETCVRAYPELDRLATLDKPRAWLIHVMRRLYIDGTRRYERRHVESIEVADTARLVAVDADPLDAADGAQRAERLDAAWQRLDADQRSLLALHDIEGYSLAELVELTALKEGTIKSRLHRARVKLGRLLEREERTAAGRGQELKQP